MLTARLAVAPELNGITVESAGTGAWDGAPASEGSKRVALERGLDLAAHQARLITANMVRDADLILTMAASHSTSIAALGDAAKVHLLSAYAGEAGSNIADPFGQDVSAYRETADQLDRLLGQVVARLRRERAG